MEEEDGQEGSTTVSTFLSCLAKQHYPLSCLSLCVSWLIMCISGVILCRSATQVFSIIIIYINYY